MGYKRKSSERTEIMKEREDDADFLSNLKYLEHEFPDWKAYEIPPKVIN